MDAQTFPLEYFQKLDMRIGRIISAEALEGSDRLLKMKIDFGGETRQLVAGIAKYYQPDFLIGKEVPVIVNLEPKFLKGQESQGMMLAVDAEGRPVLLHPDSEVPPGSVIK